MNYKDLIDRIEAGYEPDAQEIESLIQLDRPEAEYLFNAANRTTQKYCGNKVHIRGIIEFSNYCRCRCLYCGINCDNNDVKRYRMEPDEIIENAALAYKAGYRTVVLQSGEDLWYTRDKISYIVKSIKSAGDMAITLSVGERNHEDYLQWFRDGADRFLIKHETADEKLYNMLHPHSNFNNRLKCLRDLKKIGYQLGSGFMVGLPGQTAETIAKDILLLKELDVDMAGIGPFIPHPKTGLKEKAQGSTFLTLKAVAVSRLLIKKVHLPATTALGVLNSDDKENAFSSGANVIMIKVQDHKYRKLYEIYPKGEGQIESIEAERRKLENFIMGLGREVSDDRGDSLKLKEDNYE